MTKGYRCLTSTLHALHQQQSQPKPGRAPAIAFADQVLLTVLHYRLGLTREPLAILFDTAEPPPTPPPPLSAA
ncbi:DDE transposase family protein [Nocardia uniformis]|uniref:DDE transposase family protein n=1 Tax=Nocardia uniformis TaxID=53432 RepID=A0A849C5S9_9NOCA|nr:DDE transposase family protein [Nocardia uniformis]NNH74044.1 DDE transposase family protein [Nocardia uniformis]